MIYELHEDIFLIVTFVLFPMDLASLCSTLDFNRLGTDDGLASFDVVYKITYDSNFILGFSRIYAQI